jgi:hypothetical protein
MVKSAAPKARGILFDSAQGLRGAEDRLAEAGVLERCEIVEGDFFQSLPEGASCYVLKSVIHDWDDERATAILRNCRKAMGSDGTVLVVEQVVPPEADPSSPSFGLVLSDLYMLACATGQERTAEEFRALLDGAGLKMSRIVDAPKPSEFRLIEAVAAAP